MPDIKLQCLDDTNSQIFVVNQTSGVLSYIDIISTGIIQATATNGNYQVNNTQSSTNSTTGGIVCYGGISIANTSDATSIKEGGGLTVAGGASIEKNLILGGKINGTTISTGNLGDSISTGTIYVSSDVNVLNNLYVHGQLISVSETIVNEIITNSTTTTLYVTDSFISTNSNTIGNIFTTSANVGIGTTSPETILQIGNGGRLYISNTDLDYTLIGSNDTDSSLNNRIVMNGSTGNMEYNVVNDYIWYNEEVPIMILNSSGNLGIGTTSPNTKLDVLGNANISQMLSAASIITNDLTAGNINLTNLSVSSLVGTTISIATLYTPDASTGNLFTEYHNVTNSSIDNLNVNSITTGTILVTSTLNASYNSNTLGSLFTTDGNIGIGTTSPSSQLNILNTTDNLTDPTTIFLDKNSVRSAMQTWNEDDETSTLIIGNNTYFDTSGNIILYNTSGNPVGWAMYLGNSTDTFDIRRTIDFNVTESMFKIVSSGNIGLGGQENPMYTLDVTGTGNFSSGLSSASLFTTDLNTVSLTTTNLNVTDANISNGTISSAIIIDEIVTNSTTTNLVLTNGSVSNLIVDNCTTSNLNTSSITTSTIVADTGITAGDINFTGALYQNGSLYVSSQWTGTTGTLLYYGTSGSVNVGIGTSDPSYTLDINGNLHIQNGSLLATYNSNTLGNLYTTGGNVGINTSSPINTLDIDGIIHVSNLITTPNLIATNITTTELSVSDITTTNLVVTAISSSSLDILDITTGSLYSSDQIRIGNVDLLSTLSIVKHSDVNSIESSVNGLQIYSTDGITSATLYMGADKDNNIAYIQVSKTGTTLPLLLNNNGGFVGINTSSPQYTLDVNGAINTDDLISTNLTTSNLNVTSLISSDSELTNLSSSNSILIDASISNLSSTYQTTGYLLTTDTRVSESFVALTSTIGNIFTTGGNIGINNTSPEYGLDINTITRITDTAFSDNSTTGSLITLGGISINGTNASSFTSGGALTVNGGIAVSQDAYIGGSFYVAGVNTTLQTGLETIGNVSTIGTYQKEVTLSIPMENTNYKVVGNITTTTNNYNTYAVSFCNITTNGFTANIYRLDAFGSAWTDVNLCLSWVVYP